MSLNGPMQRLGIGALLALLATSVPAVEVKLDTITAFAGTGDFKLRIDGRARFQFNPDTRVLTSSGTWTGEYVFGPDQITRFSHKVQDMVASADGRLSMKSYECVEGTFGATVIASYCGNYRFGPNLIDEGGAGDDVVVGPPKSLTGFTVTALTWDGKSLLLVLSSDDPRQAVFPESSLELKFSAVK